ncbi:MAG: hypothetical protein ACD_43C00125G0001, partial [uncultured bacterium]
MATSGSLSVVDMLQAGIHFGHKPSKRHPKMSPYIFGIKNGISMIDLERTKEQLEKILPVVETMATAGKSILFLGTKPQAQAVVKAAAEKAGMPFIVERWLGGLLTNYAHVSLSMKKLTQLKEEKEQGVWAVRYTKKEQLMFEREIESLEELVGGIESMTKLPDAMFVVDCKKEKTAIKEANKLHIPVIAMVDTNVNPAKIDYPIPANDDGIKSITYISNQIVAAIER